MARNTSTNIILSLYYEHYINSRWRRPSRGVADHVAREFPKRVCEKAFDLNTLNKVFCSEWFSRDVIVMGTKCNKVCAVNLSDKSYMLAKETLKCSELYEAPTPPSGIHCLAINPSKTLVATGAKNTNDIAIFKLLSQDGISLNDPFLYPHAVCEGGHLDWLFGCEWLDDEFLLTGGRDGHICLWNVPCDLERLSAYENQKAVHDPDWMCSYPVLTPLMSRRLNRRGKLDVSRKIRTICVNSWHKECFAMVLVVPGVFQETYNIPTHNPVSRVDFHTFDIETFKRKSQKMVASEAREAVCVALHTDRQLYAMGTNNNLHLVDADSLAQVKRVSATYRHSWEATEDSDGGAGIRSLSFRNDLITIGRGDGAITFFDLRNLKFLPDCQLEVGEGWLAHDSTFHNWFSGRNQAYPPAIYTHSYDPTGTRLFAAGGPLPTGLTGNYAAVFV